MSTTNQAAAAREWRTRVRHMRAIAGLRSATPDPGALASLDVDNLAAAAANPDHSEAGRAAAAQALRQKSASPERWRLCVPGFLTATDLERGERLFFGWGRSVRVWSGRCVWFILAVVLALAAFNPAPTPEQAFGDQSDLVFGLIGAAMIVALSIWWGASALRRRPARVLLLRKFNEAALAAPLDRAIARELRPFGHIATLSDRYIKEDMWGWLSPMFLSLTNPLAALWFALGAPVRLVLRLFDRSHMGPAVVLNARDYRNLAKRLRDRIGLNVRVAMSRREALPVRTSDPWWRAVVQLLLDSSDAIVVDLSRVTEGTAWELDLIREENAGARCVFIALWGRADEAQAALQRWGFPNTCFYYAPDGEMQRRSQFRAALIQAMRATHAATA